MIKKKSPLREIFLLVGFYDFTTLLSALSPLIGEKGFEEQLSELWTVDSLWAVVRGLWTIIRRGKQESWAIGVISDSHILKFQADLKSINPHKAQPTGEKAHQKAHINFRRAMGIQIQSCRGYQASQYDDCHQQIGQLQGRKINSQNP